jgi:hypothetical protein
MNLSLYDLYTELKAKRILFCYSGPIAQTSIEGVGNTLRRNLEAEEAGNTITLSVFSIFIEQVQNILNYSAERLNKDEQDENELRVGIVVIGHEQCGDYFIYCGNKIYSQDIARLKNNIDNIRNLNKDELKLLYRERRKMEAEPGSKGAGLGLIEMARRSSEPIQYSFEKIDDEFSFFSIKVVVRR